MFFDITRRVLHESEVEKTFWKFSRGPPGSTKSGFWWPFIIPTFYPQVSQKWRISSFLDVSRWVISEKYAVHHRTQKIKDPPTFSTKCHFGQKWPKMPKKYHASKQRKMIQKTPKSLTTSKYHRFRADLVVSYSPPMWRTKIMSRK